MQIHMILFLLFLLAILFYHLFEYVRLTINFIFDTFNYNIYRHCVYRTIY